MSFAGNNQPVSFAAESKPQYDRQFNESPLDQFKNIYDKIEEELPEK